MIEEADENNQTVGVGGRPDRDGNVTLYACIMDKNKDRNDFQIVSIAINKKRETGGYCIHSGFSYSMFTKKGQTNHQSDAFLKT